MSNGLIQLILSYCQQQQQQQKQQQQHKTKSTKTKQPQQLKQQLKHTVLLK